MDEIVGESNARHLHEIETDHALCGRKDPPAPGMERKSGIVECHGRQHGAHLGEPRWTPIAMAAAWLSIKFAEKSVKRVRMQFSETSFSAFSEEKLMARPCKDRPLSSRGWDDAQKKARETSRASWVFEVADKTVAEAA